MSVNLVSMTTELSFYRLISPVVDATFHVTKIRASYWVGGEIAFIQPKDIIRVSSPS
jgi:hypothetical protein